MSPGTHTLLIKPGKSVRPQDLTERMQGLDNIHLLWTVLKIVGTAIMHASGNQ